MPKRGNDNPQMRREDYESMESSRDDGGAVAQGVFEKAPEAVQQKRRVLSVKRPKRTAEMEGSQSSEKKTGAFSGFSFGGTTPAAASTTPTPSGGGVLQFGGGSQSERKAAPGGAAGFSFGTNGSSSTSIAPGSTNKPFAFSSAPAPFGSASSSSSSSSLANRYQALAKKLEGDFLSEVQKYPSQYTDYFKAIDHYLDAAQCLEDVYWSKAKEAGDSSSGGGGAPKTTTFSIPLTEKPKTTTNLFSALAEKPATTPAASSGQSFSFTPGSAVTPAAAETPGGGGDTTTVTDDSLLEGDADKDWTVLKEVHSVFFFKYVGEKPDVKCVKVCGGQKLKFQEHKETKSRRMIMRNEASGKVMLNISIAKGVPVAGSKSASKKHLPGMENVNFVGVLDPNRGPESLLMRRKIDSASVEKFLMQTMQQMAAF